jgi:S1-C subfamily serine protease
LAVTICFSETFERRGRADNPLATTQVVKPKVDDKEISGFLKILNRELRATDAAEMLQSYIDAYELSTDQQQRLTDELNIWKNRAKEGLERLGKNWVNPEVVRAAEEESQQLIARAEAISETGNAKDCLEMLKEASKANPNGIEADYWLGMLYSMPFAQLFDTDEAEKHFKVVLQRFPDHPAALNSLAITLVKQGELAPAFNNFKRASEVSRICPEVVHNLGRVVYLVDGGRLRGDKGILRKYSDLYSELIVSRKTLAFDKGVGWKHMLPVFGEKERQSEDDGIDGANKAKSSAKLQLSLFGFGSGFVIDDEIVITNRHVVDDQFLGMGVADRVTVGDPFDSSGKRELDGKIVAVSKKSDLAAIQVPGLKSPPLKLRPQIVKLGTEVFVLGFPEPEEVGFGLKATRGMVASVPVPGGNALSSLYYYDAATGPGSSGGPVFDMSGAIVAVHVVGTRTKIGLNGGIPVLQLTEFLSDKKFSGDVVGADEQRDLKDLVELIEANSKSVLQIRTYYRTGLKTIAAASKQTAAPFYEDKSCPLCKGRGGLGCPRPGCVGGAVTSTTYVTRMVAFGMIRQSVRVPVHNKERCPTCNGRGFVDCPGCNNGIDKFLSR